MSLSIVHVIARLNVGGAALPCPPARPRAIATRTRRGRRRGHARRRRGVDGVRRGRARREAAQAAGAPARASPRADPAAILALRELIRQRRPDVLHTHTAKAGATGRLAALARRSARPARDRPHLPRPRPQRLLQPALGADLPRDRACCSRIMSGTLIAVSDEVRDDLVWFGVAPARALRRRPVRLRPASVGRGGRARRERAMRAEIGVGDETFVSAGRAG